MKKKFRFTSLTLALVLIFSLFGGTAAFAAENQTIQFSNDFTSVTELDKGVMQFYGVQLTDTSQTLSVTSSDKDILEAEVQELAPRTGVYLMDVMAWKAGTATLTFTASDGSTVSQTITVNDTEVQKNYTLTSDTVNDFSLAQGNSYTIKLHYAAKDSSPGMPLLLTDDQENIVGIRLVDADPENGDYFYRVDAVGSVGQSAVLYTTNMEFVPEKLCKVTITANKNLSLDTNASTIYQAEKPEFVYICNVGDTYRFVARTSSATVPKVGTTANGVASASLIGKVPGGYEYRMKALSGGEAVVRVTQNGETASFPVAVNAEPQEPYITSDTPKSINLEKGKTYTYKFTIMGGGEPSFTTGTGRVVSAPSVRKDGINYFVTVTGTGKANTGTSLNVTFPQSSGSHYTQNVANITLTQPKAIRPKSDTNGNFSVKLGQSYTFKITGAASFGPGTAGVFKTEKLKTSGNDVYYRITAIGKPGQQTGFYMAAAGQSAQRVCLVTVDPPAEIRSDTDSDFTLAKNASYQFKITAPGTEKISFGTGTAEVFTVSLVKHTGNDFYYRITAVGKSGSASGLYASLPGQSAKRVCTVSVA
jgi:hypothetical protein